MSISGNSFFENSEFEFYEGEESLGVERSDMSANNLVLSFWSKDVVSSKSLGGTVKIYTNGFLPEGVLEMTYTLFESSTANLTFSNNERNQLTGLTGSYKKMKSNKADERQVLPVDERAQYRIANDKPKNREVQLQNLYTKLGSKRNNRTSDEFAFLEDGAQINQSDKDATKNRSSQSDQDPMKSFAALVDSEERRLIPHSPFRSDNRDQLGINPRNSGAVSEILDSGKVIFVKRIEVFRLKTAIERSALLIIPFKIFFKDRTLIHSASSTYSFEERLERPRNQKPETLMIQITHMIEFRFRGAKEETNSEVLNPMKDRQIFVLHPDYERMEEINFERTIQLPSYKNFLARLFRFKPREIRIKLDRTVLVGKNFSANLTVSYPKGLIADYDQIKIVVCQRYISIADPSHLKNQTILEEEISLVKQFVSPKLKTLEFVYRLPFEKVAHFNLQSAVVSLLEHSAQSCLRTADFSQRDEVKRVSLSDGTASDFPQKPICNLFVGRRGH